jgi:hypothetical protein
VKRGQKWSDEKIRALIEDALDPQLTREQVIYKIKIVRDILDRKREHGHAEVA